MHTLCNEKIAGAQDSHSMLHIILCRKHTPIILKKGVSFLFFVLLFGIICSCSGTKQFAVSELLPDDRRDIPQPESREIDLYAYTIDKLFDMSLRHKFEFSRLFRKISEQQKQAMNANAFDEVSNSSWFTNRNALDKLTIEEIARGPISSMQNGPDQNGPWTIVRAKAEGITPGFTIEDSKGDRFVIKFDPPGYSELATGAEVVCTILFFAAGYNVPENNITFFNPDILVMGDKVEFTDKQGNKRIMNRDDLDDILSRVHYLPDGRIRAMASKYLEGIPLGPFRYERTRPDDPNDFVPHEHRRELRGLRLICAWLNHFDTKAGNSFDGYVTENGRKYVRHYLMDFGSTLGSAAYGPVPPYVGVEHVIDVKRILLNFFSLGLYRYPFEMTENQGIIHPSIGYYPSESFHPHKYKSHMPNPAFLNMTNRDGFWASKIVMSFTDEQLKTAVDQGKYSDPEAAEYLVKTLKARRDIIGRYWFNRMNPLDKFTIHEKPNGEWELLFADLAVETGLESAGSSTYQYSVRNTGDSNVVTSGSITDTRISLPKSQELRKRSITTNLNKYQDTAWEVIVRTRRSSDGERSKWVKVYFKIDTQFNRYLLLGLQRQE